MDRTLETSTGDLVPYGERVHHLQWVRLAAAAMVTGFAAVAPDVVGGALRDLMAGTTAYLLLTMLAEVFWRLSRRRGLPLFSLMLIVDALYLSWIAFATGGTASPYRYLSLLHVGAVALLASYRTGLKLALWHSLLVIAAFHAQAAGLLRPAVEAPSRLPGSDFKTLAAFVVTLWLVAVANATFSAVNERELRRRRFDLEALAALARELDVATGPEGVAGVLLDNLLASLGYLRGAVLRLEGGQAHVIAERGGVPTVAPTRRFPLPEGSLLTRAAQSRRTLLVSAVDPAVDSGLAALLPAARNLVVVPLQAEGGGVGAVVVERGQLRGPRVERRVVVMTERFVDHAGLALLSATLLEQLQSLARTDGLTGLANRRTFEQTLPREISRARRTGEPVSLVLVDVDHFKRINDTHGHQAGDEVLRAVAAIVAHNCRDFDTSARYGGEEFAVVLPGTGPAEALTIAERFRAAVASAELPLPVTISAGAATFPLHADGAEQLLQRADEALYTSKRAGRNIATLSPHATLVEGVCAHGEILPKVHAP